MCQNPGEQSLCRRKSICSHAEAQQATVSEGLPTWGIEWYSNRRASSRKAPNLPLSHHTPLTNKTTTPSYPTEDVSFVHGHEGSRCISHLIVPDKRIRVVSNLERKPQHFSNSSTNSVAVHSNRMISNRICPSIKNMSPALFLSIHSDNYDLIFVALWSLKTYLL